MLLAFAFGCEDDDGEIVHRSGDARLIDVEVPLEDSGASDSEVLDIEVPVADGILPSLDMVLPVVDLDLVDSEAPEILPVGDAGPEDVDVGELDLLDSNLSDM